MSVYLRPLHTLGLADVAEVGGKNASLGEMLQGLSATGGRVPEGFSTTASAYRDFLSTDSLGGRIAALLDTLDVDDVRQLQKGAAQIRAWVLGTSLPERLVQELSAAYRSLGGSARVAVRSSATAEDLPQASFAGQQESFLHIAGVENVLQAVHRVFASLFTDRAVAYRVHQGFRHEEVAICVGIQRMIDSGEGASGVLFTLDTETGFQDVILITASYGLGEAIVQGSVNPDEYCVYKQALGEGRASLLRRTLGSKELKIVRGGDAPGDSVRTVEVSPQERGRFVLGDDQVVELARLGLAIEQHYGRPVDVEWAQDAQGEFYVLQARPETVRSNDRVGALQQRFLLRDRGTVLSEGRSVGHRIGAGEVRIIENAATMEKLALGEVLVTDMTDPDWEPVMKRAAAIVTNRGGRTCHAAIIARELGIPAVVGCGDATEVLRDGMEVTVSCAEGETGHVYAGLLDFDVEEGKEQSPITLPTKLMLNVGNPERAFDFRMLPNDGVGLARLEFIINRMIGVHPRAVLEYQQLPEAIAQEVARRATGFESPVEFFRSRLTEGIATLAAAFYPKPVIVRLSDFKSNEYVHLVGGELYEPQEENPMLGLRGASRYVAPSFRDCFALECAALRDVRELMGLDNVEIMVPFVRTLGEAREVTELLAQHELRRGEGGLRLIMMCELPANALLAEEFLEYFDGFSIGSNDLTQLTLGLDRDSALVAHLFREDDPAVLVLLKQAIHACRAAGKYVGICGQGPSDHPQLVRWLVEQGIDSLSLNPDAVGAVGKILQELAGEHDGGEKL